MAGRASKAVLLLATCAVAAAIAASAAQAADVTVGVLGCQNQGGVRTVPAGSTITVRIGFSEQTRGILTALLNAQTTTITLNGTSVDVSNAFPTPTLTQAGDYTSLISYPTGITLAAGDSLSVVWTTTLSHIVPEVFNPAAGGPPGKPAFGTDPVPISCTVIAV